MPKKFPFSKTLGENHYSFWDWRNQAINYKCHFVVLSDNTPDVEKLILRTEKDLSKIKKSPSEMMRVGEC
jgi:hypothetical protein